MAAAVHLTVVAPDNEKFTVQSTPARLPRRKPNAEYFEATVGGSSCPRLAELFKKSRGMLDGSLFALKYLPPNEESRSSGRQGSNRLPRPDWCAPRLTGQVAGCARH